MKRRAFLGGLAAGAGLGFPARPARAAAAADTLFVFVTIYGGWDPTRVFTPAFDAEVDMEIDAVPASAGGLPYVDHPERPSVRAFLEEWHERTLFLNGILVPSVAHPASLRRVFTGTGAEGASDWPALIAAAKASSYTLPHLVISGPSYPGTLGAVVTRTGTSGQLGSLLAGGVAVDADVPVPAPSPAAQSRVDAYVAGRAADLLAQASTSRDRALLSAVTAGLGSGADLAATQESVRWTATGTFADQVTLAADVLSAGISRCVSLAYEGLLWDTHGDNDWYQTRDFEGLFGELRGLLSTLAATPGRSGGSLADQTVVVVLSEMGRSPLLNHSAGKDHWPYTSAMLVGPGLAGDRAIGGWDEHLYGREVDPVTGELDAEGTPIHAEIFGATLLARAGVDPGEALPGVEVLLGALDG